MADRIAESNHVSSVGDTLSTDRYGRVPGGLESRIRGLGFHSTRDVHRETTMERNSSGTLEERVVAVYGTGMKWNEPACAFGG